MSIAKTIQDTMHASIMGIVLFYIIFITLDTLIPLAPFKSFEVAYETNSQEQSDNACELNNTKKNPAQIKQKEEYNAAWRKTATKRFYFLIPLLFILHGLLYITSIRSISMAILINILGTIILILFYRPHFSALITLMLLTVFLIMQIILAKKQG